MPAQPPKNYFNHSFCDPDQMQNHTTNSQVFGVCSMIYNKKGDYYCNLLFVIPKRFERLTHALEGRCSIQLSYGTILNCGAKVMLFLKLQKHFCVFLRLSLCRKGYNPKGKPVKYHKINNKVQAIKM